MNSNFLGELRRRKVFRVAAGYAVAGWAVIEVCATVIPALHLPDWITTAIVVLTLAGFPLALVLAWAFDVTPEGVQRTAEIGPGNAPRARRGMWWVAAAGILLAASSGAALWHWQFRNAPAAVASPPAPASEATAPNELKSVAVLPFVNLSGDPANEYFSDGITEEILNAIAHLPDLRVASRTSAFAYKGKNEDVAAIALALRVNNLLEGTVQRMGERIRITAQLIDAKSGFHLWSEKFDRETKDLFAVQDEIAQAIARALKLRLSDRGSATQRGTENIDSHELYLKALDLRDTSPQNALEQIDRALALDPHFAAAYALKARLLSALAFASPASKSWNHHIEQGEQAAKRAVELDPNLADAYAALGEMARRRGDFASARANLERATQLKPADPDIWQGLGLVLSSIEPERATKALQKAKDLGSENLYLERQLAYAAESTGRVDEAHAILEKAHLAHPDFIPAIIDLGRYELWVRGRPDRALEWFIEAYRKGPNFVDAQVPITFYPAMVYAFSDLWPQAEAWLAREMATAPEAGAITTTQLLFAGLRQDQEKAGTVLRDLLAEGGDEPLRSLQAGDAAGLVGDWKTAADQYRQALAESWRPTSTRGRRLQVRLAYSLRQLGDENECTRLLREAGAGLEHAPRFALMNWTIYPLNAVHYLDAEIFALLGEKEKSLDALDATLALPDDGFIPIGSLPVPIENSPYLAGLREEPRFTAFVKEVARRRAVLRQRVDETRRRLGLDGE